MSEKCIDQNIDNCGKELLYNWFSETSNFVNVISQKQCNCVGFSQ